MSAIDILQIIHLNGYVGPIIKAMDKIIDEVSLRWILVRLTSLANLKYFRCMLVRVTNPVSLIYFNDWDKQIQRNY